jgi:hypothetical protein
LSAKLKSFIPFTLVIHKLAIPFLLFVLGNMPAQARESATECFASVAPAPLEVNLIVENFDRQLFVADGVVAKRFETPAAHRRGGQNKGLFSLQREGSARLLKVLMSVARRSANDELQMAIKAQKVGGPRVYRWGQITFQRSQGESQSFLYMEMEELFAGRPSSTWKGRRSTFPSRKVAELFLRAYEARLSVGSDVDFIVSESDAAWLDTADWKDYTGREIGVEFLSGLGAFWAQISKNREETEIFRADLRAVLAESQKLDPDVRAVLQNFFSSR